MVKSSRTLTSFFRYKSSLFITDGNKITGIQLDDQTKIDANNVICNADPPAVYEKMLNGNKNNSLLFKWKKIEWNTQWDYLFIILEPKKLMMM